MEQVSVPEEAFLFWPEMNIIDTVKNDLQYCFLGGLAFVYLIIIKLA